MGFFINNLFNVLFGNIFENSPPKTNFQNCLSDFICNARRTANFHIHMNFGTIIVRHQLCVHTNQISPKIYHCRHRAAGNANRNNKAEVCKLVGQVFITALFIYIYNPHVYAMNIIRNDVYTCDVRLRKWSLLECVFLVYQIRNLLKLLSRP